MLFRRKQEITHADTTVRARAKINLTLDVTGRREDGYHTVEMVMQSDPAAYSLLTPSG